MGKKTIIALTALALLGLGGGAYLELGGKAPAGAGEAAAEGEGSGPRGGMLLRQGDLTLELLVPEDGSPLKAWVERGGKALAPQEVVLGADVERAPARSRTCCSRPAAMAWWPMPGSPSRMPSPRASS
ncbi:Resistance-Nodulation-Cell Division (RND) divalent metal cation efflux membrane fusion protein CzcB precursor [Pseudomonas aeruginosa]|nr:Resistance-Nodulation-Cell Division (RND) divalent metal cation efflux membrane fusion protein CzcB precursor [Pseudomonas aeruginosa]